ncbi:response regulator [Desulfospira joergensenii]|uniref:response regulator n=1 Tax=Desulfospira joergensenii TaxID=53329 RepID=UPI0003B6F214|nr:response regulator [Desulfospira joergensenii]
MVKKEKRPKILVVDDDPDMRIFFSALLKTGGFHPIVAGNGKEGLDKVKKENPAFIIIDVPMPDNGGMQMYRCLKQDKTLCCIPVIMVSTIDQQTFTHYQKTKGVRLGHDISGPEAFLEKPPEAAEVLDLIRETLTRSMSPNG